MPWQNIKPQYFYPFLIPHVIKLCLKYKMTLKEIQHANPALPYGGIALASKNEVNTIFNANEILDYVLIKASMSKKKKQDITDKFLKKHAFPIILKPDVGHRGVDVKLIKSKQELKKHLKRQKWDYLLQEFCDYKQEYGVFYAKLPKKKGKIVSITKKTIPILIGDGKSTIRELIIKSDSETIENKPVLLERYKHRENDILKNKEKLRTLVCASHARGAVFTDAKHLLTKELEQKILKVSNIKGFNFGRYDLKAKNTKEFQKGNFKIIEINGATSEMTHIWDKNFTFKKALKTLKTQWNMLFRIAHYNKHNPINDFVHSNNYESNFFKSHMRFFKKTKDVIGKMW